MDEIDTLLKKLSEAEDARAVRRIIGKLGNLDANRVVETIIEMLDTVRSFVDDPILDDPEWDDVSQWERVIESICIALGRLEDRRAVLPLIDLIEYYNQEWTYQAILALGKIGDERAIPALIRVLENTEKGEKMRRESARVLTYMERELGIETTIRLLPSKDETERNIAAWALYGVIRHGDAFYDILLDINNDSDRISSESKQLQDLIDRDAGFYRDGSVVFSKATPATIEPEKEVFYDRELQEWFYIDEDGNEVECDNAGRDLN